MKPFLNDISVWENVCYHNDIPLREDQVDAMVQLWSKYMSLSYNRFYHKGDPDLGQMASILKKIPFYYGGWSLEEADQELEAILLQSVVATVQVIFEDVYEDLSSDALNRIRNFLCQEMDDYTNNPYYKVLHRASSYSEDYERIQGHIDDVMNVVSKQHYDLEELQRARFSAQRLMEIVLQRDSKLANSSSTKNRIAYHFDQDRVSKIRYGYFEASLAGREDFYRSSIIDHSILKESMEEKELSKSIREYMKYVRAKNTSGSLAKTYFDAAGCGYLAMRVLRKNADGSVRELKKRITSSDSYYRKAEYYNGEWHGDFLWYNDLTEEEKIVWGCLNLPKTRNMIKHVEQALGQEVEGMMTYLLNRLTELLD